VKLSHQPLISIIDDDRSVREATNGLVRSLGYATAVFASAEEYLQSDHVPGTSCVITDLHMPGLSGTDLQSRLIAEGREIPVIIVTAYSDETTRAQALDAGAIAFLSKPFSEECLIECLDKALKC